MTRTFIIGGHIRSGTTLLRNLCHSHPDITVTMEFGNFIGLGESYGSYTSKLLRRCWRRRNQSFLVHRSTEHYWKYVLRSYAFVARYLVKVNTCRNGVIDVPTIETALRNIFPTTRLVGDKVAYYVFLLDTLAARDDLARVIIYRDCRDVTSSVLQKVLTDWRSKSWVKHWDSAEKVARQWVQAIELMERYADRLHIICYEELIQKPEQELDALGRYLGVDPAGFPIEMMHRGSIGKHIHGLTEEEMATVMDIAGPTMTRLGYLERKEQ